MQEWNFWPRGRVGARACVLAVTVAFGGGAAAAAPVSLAANVEGGNSFSELSRKAQEEESTTSTATTTATTTAEAKNSNTTLFIGIGAAIVLLVAIAAVIVRDARRVAPAGAVEMAEASAARDPAVRRRNRRTKAKAARAQRKKNR